MSQAVDEAGDTARQATGGAGEAAAEATGEAGEAAAEATGEAAPGGDDQPQATDAARRQARESGLDLGTLEGTGAGGTITVGDVRKAAGQS